MTDVRVFRRRASTTRSHSTRRLIPGSRYKKGLPANDRSIDFEFDFAVVGGSDGACSFAEKIDMCDDLLCGESECFGHHKLALAPGARWFGQRAPISEIFTMRSALRHQLH